MTFSLDTIITCSVSITTVCLSYYFGMKQSTNTKRYEQDKRRYETFYVPFFTKLCKLYPWIMNMSDMKFSDREKLFNLLMNNLALLDRRTQSLIPAFYEATLVLLEHEASNKPCEEAAAHLDLCFQRIIKATMAEANKLSKRLHLQPITRTYEVRLARDSRANNTTKAQAASK